MSCIGLVYRLKIENSRADVAYIVWTTYVVTCVAILSLAQLMLIFTKSTIENFIGIMCACMPFFPAIVKNSSILRRVFHSMQKIKTRVSSGPHTQKTAEPTRVSMANDNSMEMRSDYPHSREETLVGTPKHLESTNVQAYEVSGSRHGSQAM